jgi:hypothetical protein
VFDELPGDLRERADVTGSGELLWPRDAALEVVTALERAGLAVAGGEIYEPLGQASGHFRGEWDTTPGPGRGEPWADYVTRGAEQARAALAAESRRDGATRYFLAVVADRGARGG